MTMVHFSICKLTYYFVHFTNPELQIKK